MEKPVSFTRLRLNIDYSLVPAVATRWKYVMVDKVWNKLLVVPTFHFGFFTIFNRQIVKWYFAKIIGAELYFNIFHHTKFFLKWNYKFWIRIFNSSFRYIWISRFFCFVTNWWIFAKSFIPISWIKFRHLNLYQI